jgi:hypothetical protein
MYRVYGVLLIEKFHLPHKSMPDNKTSKVYYNKAISYVTNFLLMPDALMPDAFLFKGITQYS